MIKRPTKIYKNDTEIMYLSGLYIDEQLTVDQYNFNGVHYSKKISYYN